MPAEWHAAPIWANNLITWSLSWINSQYNCYKNARKRA
jgi:hypothetical protein